MRVFLDANVLFSASQSGSVFARLLAPAREHMTVMTSDLATIEARRNLALKRPAWSGTLETLLERIESVPTVVSELPVPLADKDAPLLSAAIRARCQYFVTGDRRDFAHLFDETVEGVSVITPRLLAEKLVELRKDDL